MSTMDISADGIDVLGPVTAVVVEFPSGVVGGAGFTELLTAAEAGTIRVLDLEFVSCLADGTIRSLRPADLVTDGVDLSDLAGADSHLADASDLDALHHVLHPGSVAAVLVYEDQSLHPALAAWRSAGAEVALVGHLDPADLDDVLDAAEHEEGA